MRVRYRNIPPTLRPIVRAVVSRWRASMPGWAYSLTVSYDGTKLEDFADMAGSFQHREASMTLYPPFFDLDVAGQDDTILHEIGHVLQAPLDATFAVIQEEETSKEVAERLWEETSEGVVSDYAAVFQRLHRRTMTTTTTEEASGNPSTR